MHVVHALAASAVDVAAPDELALTALDMSHQVGVVASAAAQQDAAVGAGGRSVAAASSGAGHAPPPVLQAVVRRLVDEDELVRLDRGAALLPPGLPPGPVPHLDAALVALLQVNAHLLQRRHCLPASLHATGAGDAVAAAVRRHSPDNRL